ncbi:hypothetical protein N7471_002889 [Penicillium samsonianum]|uniref:uncharacterized protein n=1 Tax=Penicillium samsonianum TaxID=1882272 RepID=UPI0025470916|nr:uncharacterized protein N7471_002889 [Penicillium samsonianum]KAJ6143436.1 hypothetical protein N7471_002889 [Penicillium samsonianum]
MEIANNGVTGINLHALIPAAFPATARSPVLLAKLLAKSTVAIPSARENATSRVLLAQKKNVFQRALTVSAQCHVQPPAIMFHVPSDVRRSYVVGTSARQYVEKNVLYPSSAKPAETRTPEIIKSISSWVKRTKKSTWTKTHAYSRSVDIS